MLTSNVLSCVAENLKPAEHHVRRALSFNLIRRLPTLPRSYPRSTIGSKRLNLPFRDGNGCDPLDRITGNLSTRKRALRIE